MKVLGIIAEYNPFHKGHLYHLEESKKRTGADVVVCVMSGNFVQRGEPALFDKWVRARSAIEASVDLVLELPFVYACNSAENFAYGGISILEGLGCVDYISFGSESGDIDKLMDIAQVLVKEPEDLKNILKKYLDEGVSYAKAWGLALEDFKGKDAAGIIKEPNNLLALEYLKRMIKINSKIKPVTIERIGGRHNDSEIKENYASASALRKKYYEQKSLDGFLEYIPFESISSLICANGKCDIQINDLFPVVVSEILKSSTSELSKIISVTEGLENKLKNEVRYAKNMDELINRLSGKRYTKTKVQRMLMHILFHLDEDSMNTILTKRLFYARVLGMNNNGQKLLKHIKKAETAHIPILTNINKDLSDGSLFWQLLNYDILATDLYNLTSGSNLYAGADYVVKPVRVESKHI